MQIEVSGENGNLTMEATTTSNGVETVTTNMTSTDTKIIIILTDVLMVILGGILQTTGQTRLLVRGLMSSITMNGTTGVTGNIMTDITMTISGGEEMSFVVRVTISRTLDEWGLTTGHLWDTMVKDLLTTTGHFTQKNLGIIKVLPRCHHLFQTLVLLQLKDPLMNPNLHWTDH